MSTKEIKPDLRDLQKLDNLQFYNLLDDRNWQDFIEKCKWAQSEDELLEFLEELLEKR